MVDNDMRVKRSFALVSYNSGGAMYMGKGIISKKLLIYSILHMFVDGLCAFSLLAAYKDINMGISVFLVYNFCAFVLQMPFGVVLDGLMNRYDKKWAGNNLKNAHVSNKNAANENAINIIAGEYLIPYHFALAGIILVIIGAYISPIIFGIGNALFHVGGGVDTIREDFNYNKKGMELGIFVAPGALGLFLGGQLAATDLINEGGLGTLWQLYAAIGTVMIALILVLYLLIKKDMQIAVSDNNGIIQRVRTENKTSVDSSSNDSSTKKYSDSIAIQDLIMISCCFIVVVLRSYAGLGISMPWKTSFTLVLAGVLAVVVGKMAGGILAACFGVKRIVIISLITAAIGYVFSDAAIPGIIALFVFNMTMPVTLYMLVDGYRDFPGFFFGVLTVALFIGYLPVYSGVVLPVGGNVVGAVVSIVSLVLLVTAMCVRHTGRT